jgi:hypothetical protein
MKKWTDRRCKRLLVPLWSPETGFRLCALEGGVSLKSGIFSRIKYFWPSLWLHRGRGGDSTHHRKINTKNKQGNYISRHPYGCKGRGVQAVTCKASSVPCLSLNSSLDAQLSAAPILYTSLACPVMAALYISETRITVYCKRNWAVTRHHRNEKPSIAPLLLKT